MDKTIVSLFASRGYDVRKEEGTLLAIGMDGETLIMVHPFWSDEYVEDLIERVGGNPKPISVCGVVSNSIV